MRITRFSVVWLTAAWLANSPAHAADANCVNCHIDRNAQFKDSVHAATGLTCIDCHGGDPKANDETAHATDNFHRPDSKQAIAQLCASCHSDVRKMNPFGLPTDQLDRYKTSKHGEALFGKNDQRVAGCTDCHGAHDILKVNSPQARTFAANIPATCGRCHSDENLMSRYKLPADVVAQYKTSYHAQLLFEKGDLSAPTCVTCHGNHGATPPGTAEVGQVCGKCHGRQRELFEKSPHAEASAAGAFNQCVSCHGNHAIQKASVDLFASACVQCHANDPGQLARRDELVSVIKTAKVAYAKADERLHDATVRGLATDDEQILLQEAKTDITQLEALQHLLQPGELKLPAEHAQQTVAMIMGDIDHLEHIESWKRRALWPIWTFLGVMAVIFWLKRRQLE